jgi:hypothetical protein
VNFKELWNIPMKPTITLADVALDPQLQQTYAPQATLAALTRTPADLHRLRSKRNTTPKLSSHALMRMTRDQRAHDATNKLLAPDADMLMCLRRLAVGNYFCVPASQAVAVRNMTNREHRERGVKYTTTKFIYGRTEFLKVQRHNPIND